MKPIGVADSCKEIDMITRSKQNRKRLLVLAGGMIAGASFGLILSKIAASSSSQCMILCNSPIAMAYFALVGLLVSLKKRS